MGTAFLYGTENKKLSLQSPQQFFIIIEEQITKDISAADIRNAEIRAYLKNHSRNLHAPLCGIFCPNSVAVARYGAFIRTKSSTNCDAHLAESLFQTRSSIINMETDRRCYSR